MGASLYDQFHTNVKGVGPLTTANNNLQNQAQVYESVRDNLTQALSGIKATYTGNAANAMSDAFGPLVDSINDGANFAGSAAAACDFQSNSFTTAQANITKNVPVPAAPWYEPVDPWNTSHDDAVNKNSQIDSANEAAYNTYGSDTTSNVNFVESAAPDNSGFGNFAVQQQGPGSTVGTSSGAPSVGGSGSSGGGGSGSRGGSGAGRGPGYGYSTGPSGSGGTGPGGSGVSVPPNGSSSSTSTSGFPGTDPGGTNQGGYPGGNYPGGSNPGGPGGGSPWGSPGGGQFNGDGPGGMGPIGGMAGYSGGGGGGAGGFGGSSGGSGGGASGMGRGGFGSGAAGESGSGSGGGSGARSGAGALGGAEEGEFGGPGGTAGARGGAGGMGGMGRGGGRGGQDEEHKTAGYLVNEENGSMIVGDFDPVAPPVIGE